MRTLAKNKKMTKSKTTGSKPKRKRYRSLRAGTKKIRPHRKLARSRKNSVASKDAKLSSMLAWRLGGKAALGSSSGEGADALQHVQEQWSKESLWIHKAATGGKYLTIMKAFIEGYFSTKPNVQKPDWVLLPTDKKVAAVVMAMNEEQSIASAIRELERMPLHEVIVVVNGSTDSSLNMARTSDKAIILHYNEALGHDVGRAIGAKVTTADIVLFIDADIPVAAEQLVSFVMAASRGVDVALNDLSRYVGLFSAWDEVTIVKDFLNRANLRHDLSMNSITAVPHALTRKAIEVIGTSNLAVPPKAQAIALNKGLRIGMGGSINVFSANRHRKDNIGASNPISKLIMGDHLEALGWAMKEESPRLKYGDRLRRRDCVTDVNEHHYSHV